MGISRMVSSTGIQTCSPGGFRLARGCGGGRSGSGPLGQGLVGIGGTNVATA